MSVMERRLQLLLDQDRYARVAEEARRSGRSVAAVIREAIDARFSDDHDDDARRAAAAREFVQMAKDAQGREEAPGETSAELKAAYQAELDAKFARLGL